MGLENVSMDYHDRHGFLNILTVSATDYTLVINQFITGHCNATASGGPIEVTLDIGEERPVHHEYSITTTGHLRTHLYGLLRDGDMSHLLPFVPVLHQAFVERREQDAKDLVAVVLQALEK